MAMKGDRISEDPLISVPSSFDPNTCPETAQFHLLPTLFLPPPAPITNSLVLMDDGLSAGPCPWLPAIVEHHLCCHLLTSAGRTCVPPAEAYDRIGLTS